MKLASIFCLLSGSLSAQFYEIASAQELQSFLSDHKECIIAIGLDPCIPCEKIKKELEDSKKELPDIYWIDVKKLPRIRHVFPFKAVPYLAVYQDGKETIHLTGEKSCLDYVQQIKKL